MLYESRITTTYYLRTSDWAIVKNRQVPFGNFVRVKVSILKRFLNKKYSFVFELKCSFVQYLSKQNLLPLLSLSFSLCLLFVLSKPPKVNFETSKVWKSQMQYNFCTFILSNLQIQRPKLRFAQKFKAFQEQP